jgi:hypothetical protein
MEKKDRREKQKSPDQQKTDTGLNKQEYGSTWAVNPLYFRVLSLPDILYFRSGFGKPWI